VLRFAGARVLLAVLVLSACSREAPSSVTMESRPILPVRPAGGEFVPRSHPAKNGAMPYRLYIPRNYDPARRYPLILWLHGAGGSGSDNTSQLTGDQVPGAQSWTTPGRQAEHPAFVLVPQAQNGWAESSPDLAPNLEAVMGILDAVSAEFPIDRKRVYALGQSIGGHGVWNLVSNEPERFAAAVIVCPALGDISKAASPAAATLPMWIFVGDHDTAGIVTTTRVLVAALRAAGGNPRYTEYRNAGHDIWTRVFNEPQLAPWLFAQTR
jgi:predicted peptidase